MADPIKLTVFLKGDLPTEEESNVHDKLVAAGLIVFVDRVHSLDYLWFKHNFKQTNCRFFWSEMKALPLDFVGNDEESMPILVAYFDDSAKVEVRDWVYISAYLSHLITGSEITPHHLRLGKGFVQPATVVTSEKVELKATPPNDPDREHYALRTFEVKERDAKLFELWKPHCDLPFTVMITPYSTKGDIPFFSSLFACSSWGVARLDAEFLRHVWRDMGLPGDLDLDALLKAHTEACMPSDDTMPQTEPKVYRATIELVLQKLQANAEGALRVKRHIDETEKTFKVEEEIVL